MAKVLIVDDAAFARKRCARFLEDSGYEVVEAENGADAVRLYGEVKPDAVLMDITMPEMDGLTALNEIRRGDPDARVAILAAQGQQAIATHALNSGARGLVSKPFQPAQMLTALKEMMR
ncbi:MAG: response regulator [Dehalococcoidales bacterium]|nr:response regulator [Dehalococcoidales bacterium]